MTEARIGKACRAAQCDLPKMLGLMETRRREVVRKYFGTMLARGQRTGILRKDIPARVMTDFLLSATEAILAPLKASELKLLPKAEFPSIVSAALRIVLKEQGKVKA